MIKVTKINGERFVINSDLIEFIDQKPDTIISMTSGKKVIVTESIDEIIKLIIEYRKSLN